MLGDDVVLSVTLLPEQIVVPGLAVIVVPGNGFRVSDTALDVAVQPPAPVTTTL